MREKNDSKNRHSPPGYRAVRGRSSIRRSRSSKDEVFASRNAEEELLMVPHRILFCLRRCLKFLLIQVFRWWNHREIQY